MHRYALIAKDAGGTERDISQIVQSINWSGDIKQITRQLCVTVAAPTQGMDIPELNLGSSLFLQVQGAQKFVGTLVTRRRASMGSTVDLTALDGGWRLAQNQGFYKFQSVTADQAARTVCQDFGIPVARLASGGKTYSRKFPGVPLDKIISTMYTFAGEDSGKRYLSRFDGMGNLEVVEKPLDASAAIAPRVNSMGIDISEDISKMSTLVSLYSDDGKLIRTIAGQEGQELGLSLQKIMVQREGADAKKEADAYLADNGLSQTITVDCLGAPEFITGNAVILHENTTGAMGLCWIDSDTHTWKNGQYFCKLKMNFRNLMNKTTGGSEVK